MRLTNTNYVITDNYLWHHWITKYVRQT